MAERREQRESEAPSAASQASLKQRKQRAEKEPGRNAPHSPKSGCAQPCTHGPRPCSAPSLLQQPRCSVPGGGKRNLAPHRACDAPKTQPGGRLPAGSASSAAMRYSRSFCPFSWDQGLLPRCPCLLSVAPTSMTASPGDHGRCTQAAGWGDPPFPLCTPARRLIAPVLQASSRPSRPAIASAS